MAGEREGEGERGGGEREREGRERSERGKDEDKRRERFLMNECVSMCYVTVVFEW